MQTQPFFPFQDIIGNNTHITFFFETERNYKKTNTGGIVFNDSFMSLLGLCSYFFFYIHQPSIYKNAFISDGK